MYNYNPIFRGLQYLITKSNGWRSPSSFRQPLSPLAMRILWASFDRIFGAAIQVFRREKLKNLGGFRGRSPSDRD
jgi:hypothetical protein